MTQEQRSHIPADYVEVTPGVCGGRPRVRGTRMKVSQIVSEYEHLGMSPDQIAEAHSHLSLAEIHAALSYYYDHVEEIRREWQESNELVASLRAKVPSRLPGRPDVP
jgi:uncharacterized protein (DUF433 family)